jgi:hypothetical protein
MVAAITSCPQQRYGCLCAGGGLLSLESFRMIDVRPAAAVADNAFSACARTASSDPIGNWRTA